MYARAHGALTAYVTVSRERDEVQPADAALTL